MNSPQQLNPRPRLTVNVGITGHRRISAEAEPALRENVSAFLQTIKDEVERLRQTPLFSQVSKLYAEEPSRFVLLSSLASGADSLVAEEALKLGYELHAPLPLAREEYEKDFDTPPTLATFRDLLTRASRVFEISAANPERGHAYADAARVVLNQSDVLLALWDGRDTEYVAGTAATIAQASSQHIPVIHIHPEGAMPTCIITDGIRQTAWQVRLSKHLESLLLPVEATPPRSDLRFVRSCARQREVSAGNWRELCVPALVIAMEKGFNTILRWRPLHAILSRLPLRRVQEKRARAKAAGKVPFLAPENVFDAMAPASRAPWQEFFRHFDTLANAYSGRYRGGLLVRYLAPVLATLCLACALSWDVWHPRLFPGDKGDVIKNWKIGWFVAQAVFLAMPVMLQGANWLWMWHRKFFSYRVVSEQLRQTIFLGSVGFFMVQEKESIYKGSSQRWTAWYYRALIRHVGLPHAVVNHGYLRAWFAHTRDRFVVDQMNYHNKRWRREGNMCTKLVWGGAIMFGAGIAAAIWRGALSVSAEATGTMSLAAACALFIPALAVFFAGFCAYACYAKDQQVSLSSSNTLKTICHEMDVLLRAEGYKVDVDTDEISAPLHFSRAYRVAEQINDCCKTELLSWEDLISTKGIKHL